MPSHHLGGDATDGRQPAAHAVHGATQDAFLPQPQLQAWRKRDGHSAMLSLRHQPLIPHQQAGQHLAAVLLRQRHGKGLTSHLRRQSLLRGEVPTLQVFDIIIILRRIGLEPAPAGHKAAVVAGCMNLAYKWNARNL